MENKSLLSRLKNKYLILYLALLIPSLAFYGTNHIKNTEVKGIKIVVTTTPEIKTTEAPTLMPTLTQAPTNTPVPTSGPTDTPYPQRVYTAPTTNSIPIPPTLTPAAEQSTSQLDNNNYYTNSEGNTVHSPANTVDGSVPAGATAQCGDGTYSFSASRRGTCSHHGGVATWL